MVRARKYSGSSPFLSKFQRNIVSDEHAQPASPQAPTVTPEAILESLADRVQNLVSSLEQEFQVAPGGLNDAIEQLLKLRLAERNGGMLRLTEVGQRAAGFSKIARK